MTIKSLVTGIEYRPSEIVRIVNSSQCAAYMTYGAKLLDIYPSRDFKTHKPIVVYIFNRKDTTELYDKWCNHELT